MKAHAPGPPDLVELVEIDGASGEGGGQILRTALALSLRTRRPFRLFNVRKNRDKPGLRPQHLMAVKAAAELSGAELRGAHVGSDDLVFRPPPERAIPGGTYRFDIGTAGSAPLVLQTVLPSLMLADAPSQVTIVGGTYNPKAPPFDFVARVFAPLLQRLGPRLDLHLDRPGFYPVGGGQLRAELAPAPLRRFELLDRGTLKDQRATVLLADLPPHIAEREIAALSEALGWPAEHFEIRRLARSRSPGNVVLIELRSEHITELFSAVGERGVRAEAVARSAADEALAYLDAGVPVGEHLCDQLLLPMALGQGGSFRTTPLSLHATTQIDTLKRFLPVAITAHEESPAVVRVDVVVSPPRE